MTAAALCAAPVAPPTDDHPLIGNLTDCKYFALFDTDSSSLANIVSGGDAVTQVGTPTFGADYMETQSNAASTLKTITLPASCTPQEGEDLWVLMVARRITSGAYIAGTNNTSWTNADGTVVDECGIFGGANGPRFKNSQASDTGEAKGVWPSSSATDYFFISGYGQDRGHSYIEIGNGGTIMARLGGSDLNSRPKRAEDALFEVNPDGEGNVTLRVAALAVFHRLPLLTEPATIYTAMRTYYNGRGNIVVV